MATQLDEKIFYLKLEYGLTEFQINNIVNEIIANNDELLANTKDRDGLIYDLVVARLNGSNKEADTNNNKGKGFDVLVVTHPDVTQNIDGSTFASYVGLKAISNFEGVTLEEYNNYIQKRGAQQALLDFMKEANKEFGGKIPAARTVKRHIKEMLENDIPLIKVEKCNGKVYYKLLNCVKNKDTGKPNYFVTIPYEKVRELIVFCKPNAMKLYAIMCYATNETEYKPVTRKWLAEKMGLSAKSIRGLDDIGTMLTSLCNLGFLDRIEEVKISADGKEYKTSYKYRRTTLDEYKEAKKRGTSKKIIQ